MELLIGAIPFLLHLLHSDCNSGFRRTENSVPLPKDAYTGKALYTFFASTGNQGPV